MYQVKKSSVYSCKNKKRFKGLYIFVLALIFMTSAMFTGSAQKIVEAAGGGITVEITVSGLPTGTEAPVTFLKIVEDVPYEVTLPTKNHVVSFPTTFGGECTVEGGFIPGYSKPAPITIPLTKIKGNFVIRRTLIYVSQAIEVKGITVTPPTLKILKGFSEILTSEVDPVNASVQTVDWTSAEETIATVTGGKVSGIGMGTTAITATITDNDADTFSDSTDVSVFIITEVTEVPDLEPKFPSPGDIIQLPDKVSALVTSDGVSDTPWPDIPVQSWTCAEATIVGNTATFSSTGTYLITGSIIGTAEVAKINVEVTGPSVIQPTSVTLSPSVISVIHPTDLSPTVLTIDSFLPVDADLTDIYWISTNPAVATVLQTGLYTAEVTAVSNGWATIQVFRSDDVFLGSCFVTVSTDATLTDPVYIQATDANGVALDQFQNKDEIFITCYNLNSHPGAYAIRVSEKSSDPILGENLINAVNDLVISVNEVSPFRFKLVDYVDFEPSTSFSKSNFVSMSLSNAFPSGDYEDGTAQTLTDNFKVTSPVPTGYINVDIRQLDQYDNFITTLHPDLIGTDVILGREIKDQTVEETTYADYLNPVWYEGAPSTISKYTDEAKLIGYVADDDGNGEYKVHWFDPKEPLKIGGYVLLIEVPVVSGGSFETNLNDPDILYDELVKEVHITRNSTVYKTIIMTFIETP